MNNEKAWEAAREREMDNYFESFYDDDHFIYSCFYCDVNNPLEDMEDVLPDVEKGICKDCATNADNVTDWSGE